MANNVIDFIAGLPGWVWAIGVPVYVIAGAHVAVWSDRVRFGTHTARPTVIGHLCWLLWPLALPILAIARLSLRRRARKVRCASDEHIWKPTESPGMFKCRCCGLRKDQWRADVARTRSDKPDRSKAVRIPTGGEVPKPVTRAEMNTAIDSEIQRIHEWFGDVTARLTALEKREHAVVVRAWSKSVWVWVYDGAVFYVKGPHGWAQSYCDIDDMASFDKLPQPEAERLAAECRRALNLEVE